MTLAKEIISITLEEELKQSYLDYAMSVIVGRALPDVRDGLKPVHRRVLFAMNELGNDWNKAYKKSARIVGDVIGKYHPHGDTAVYDTIVRMAQSFSLRCPLVDGQGNFGSVDGDAPAAMRYTEIRLAKIAHTMLDDLDKETVDFAPNYDGTEFIPVVLPTRFPNLLVNGSTGIAVGMATNIPPHNLSEVIDACVAIIDNSEITLDEIINYIHGPDFPTAGIINGSDGIKEAYRTGRGRIHIRARATIEEESNGKQSIIIHELPYQVNKALLQEKMGEMVRDKKLEGISTIRDESDKDGMRVVIEIKRGEIAEVILNNLYASTQMQIVFGINMVALDNGQPRILNVLQMLQAFLQHRREIVTRRTIFELRKARQKAHILEGLGIALANIDEIIALIKAASNQQDAKAKLLQRDWKIGVIKGLLEKIEGEDISKPDDLPEEFGLKGSIYRLSDAQAQAILDLRLHRLTSLEQDKIFSEYNALLDIIKELLTLLKDPTLLMKIIRKELNDIKDQFGDKRKTEIISNQLNLTNEDLITREMVVVTLSHRGYAKIQPIADYQAQRRGGKGRIATKIKEEDFAEHILIANTHDTILCFSNRGKVYFLKVYSLPSGSSNARGKPLVNFLSLEYGEKINAILPIQEFTNTNYVFMATADGTVKKVLLDTFKNIRSNGIIALDLRESDYLVGAALTDGQKDIMLFSNSGKAIRFSESQVRPTGRLARGVRGMRLKEKHKVISLIVAEKDGTILTATENGYGKRTKTGEYPNINRAGMGVIAIRVNKRNGDVIGAIQVYDNDEIILLNNQGNLVRTKVSEISTIGRTTQGVKLISLDSDEKLVGLQRLEDIEDQSELPE